MQTPAVVHVEGRLGQLVRFVLIFGQREHIRMRQAQLAHRVIPEIGRHFAGYVAAETVDSDRVHPPMHRFLHLCAHCLAVVVQFGDIRPVVLNHQVTQAVAIVPALVLGPLAVRRRVVRYPVEDDLKAHLMRLFEKMLEVGTRTELGVDRAVVDDGVVTAECTLTGDHADRLTGHHPDDVDAVLLERRQQGFGGSKRTFFRRLTGVQFIDRCVVSKLRVT